MRFATTIRDLPQMRRELNHLPGKTVRIFCLFLAVSAASGCDDRKDPNRGPPTRYWYFDAVVEFTAEGQRLKAETTVQCMTPGGLTPGHRPLGPTASHSFVAKRLPSGAAVMFLIPRGCYAAPGRKLPPPDAIPVAYWLDDATDPTVVEKYLSEIAIGPGKHIEAIHYANVSEKFGHGEIPRRYSDPTLEVPWLKSRKFENRHKNKKSWIGYLVIYAPKELWDQHVELLHKLEAKNGIVRFQALEIPEDIRRLLDERSINKDLALAKKSTDTPDSPYQISLRARPVDLLPAGPWMPNSKYHVSLTAEWPAGKIVFRPAIKPTPIDRDRQLIVDGVVVKGPFWATFFYDTRTDILFAISQHRI